MIKLTNITKTYGENDTIRAVSSMSLDVEKGEFFCLVGPSGCGKSTILKMIAGLELPSSGTLSVDGKVSMVFQSSGLFPWLTVKQNVEFGMQMQNFSKSDVSAQMKKYIGLVELEKVIDKYPRELSGGQRQRVGLARALAVNPEILLLDEPFSALDTLTTEELHGYLLKIWRETNKTIVMVSHLLEEALLLSDRVGVMRNGEFIDQFKLAEKRPRDVTNDRYQKIIQTIKREFKN